MSKEEFIDRLKNPERYEIIEGLDKLVRDAHANSRYVGMTFDIREGLPNSHTITVYGRDRDQMHLLMTVFSLRFPRGAYNSNIMIDEYMGGWAGEFKVLERKFMTDLRERLSK